MASVKIKILNLLKFLQKTLNWVRGHPFKYLVWIVLVSSLICVVRFILFIKSGFYEEDSRVIIWLTVATIWSIFVSFTIFSIRFWFGSKIGDWFNKLTWVKRKQAFIEQKKKIYYLW